MLSGRRRFRTLLLLGAALLSAGLGVLTFETNAFRNLELNTVDTRFSIRGTEEHSGDIVVVGIDDLAFETVNQRWPFTHEHHARVLNRLRRDGAKVVAFDIQFSEPSDTDAQSLAFLDSISRTDNVVMASTDVDDYGNGNVFSYFAPLRVVDSRKPKALNDWLRKELGVEIGYSSFQPDPGGVFRRMSYQEAGLKTFSVVTAEQATGRRVDASEFDDGRAWIDYYGPPGSIREISYGDVWDRRTKPGTFRDKIVIVGATHPTLQDLHPSSTSGDGEMSGPEIQAQAVATAMRGFPLKESGDGLDLALIVLLGLVAPATGLLMSSIVRTLAVAILIGAAYTVAVQLAFNDGTILPFVYPVGALALGTVTAVAVHAVTEAFERQRTREIFGRFVPDSVVGQVLEQADGLRLGGVGRDATVMFSDLRGFTSFAESLEPDQVIRILNRYLTAMVDDAILPHGGTLVDYMGDGIMAVFGAPIEMDDHADRALAAARDKLAELDKFNEWLRTEMGFEKSFQMGIGLNSGRVMSGNVGSEQRLAYTAIGDTTNTAARLEAMTKNTPYMILLADSTRAELSAEPDDVVFVDEMEVRGRQQKVKLWSVSQSVKEEQAGETFQSVSSGPAPATEAAPPA